MGLAWLQVLTHLQRKIWLRYTQKIICAIFVSTLLQDRAYEKQKQSILKFIKKHGRVDHSLILNQVDIDYDTLMKILSELRQEGQIG